MYPNEEFLPRAPDPEELLLDDEEIISGDNNSSLTSTEWTFSIYVIISLYDIYLSTIIIFSLCSTGNTVWQKGFYSIYTYFYSQKLIV